MGFSLNWTIKVVTSKSNEQSWQNLVASLRLFFEDVRVCTPEHFLENDFGGDFIFTDDKNVFVKSRESGLRTLLLASPSCRTVTAELFEVMAFSFLTEDAYSKMKMEKRE